MKTGESKRCETRDQGRKFGCGFTRRNAATPSHIHFHIDVDDHSSRRCNPGKIAHRGRGISQHTDSRPRCKRNQTFEFGGAHHLVGDQYVTHPGFNENRGLAHFLAADPHRTERHLPQRDLGCLVTFGVGTQPHTTASKRIGHALQIALEGVEVEQQRGRINICQAIARSGSTPGGHRIPWWVDSTTAEGWYANQPAGESARARIKA